MPSKRDPVKLGATLVVVGLLFFAILLWLPSSFGGRTQVWRVRFRQSLPMPTLEVGNKVLVAGRPVGSVTKLAFEDMPVRVKDSSKESTSEHDLFLIVSAKVSREVPIRKDCHIRALGEVLGGNGTLVIDVGTAPELADPGIVIEGDPPGGFGAYLESVGRELDGNDPKSLIGRIKTQLDADVPMSLVAKLHRSMDDLNTVTRGVTVELSPEQRNSIIAKLHQTMDNINAGTASLREQLEADKSDAMLGKVHKAMDTLNAALLNVVAILDENRKPLRETVGHVESTADKLDTQIAESVARQLDVRNTTGLLTKLHTAMDQLNKSINDVSVVTGQTRDIMILNHENLNKLLLNLKETSDHLKSASKYILLHPWRLFKEPTVTETKQQAIFDAARSFSEAATRLDDAMSQLKALAKLHDDHIPPDNADLIRIRSELNQAFEKFGQAEKSLWRELDVR